MVFVEHVAGGDLNSFLPITDGRKCTIKYGDSFKVHTLEVGSPYILVEAQLESRGVYNACVKGELLLLLKQDMTVDLIERMRGVLGV